MTNWYRSRHLPIIVLLVVALLIGFLTVKDYGESWDEADIYRYGDYTLNSYSYILHPQDLPAFNTNLNLYGPAYYAITDLAARLLTLVVPIWSLINAWHFVYFLSFLGSALAIYLLSVRWMSALSAFGATLLFLSQPLLWGHAFINPKDIPFMAFFALTIYAGIKMADDYAISGKPGIMLVLAAVLLGFTVSFRVVGPLAGLIALGYSALKVRSKTIVLAALYVPIAVVTAYLTWPYLWSSLVAHYLESVRTMSQFPFATDILFWGKLYRADELPKTYFPTMLALQLTEPALLLIAAGLGTSAILFYKRENRAPFVVFLVWFLLPALVIVAAGSPIYDNGRQLYFLYPPLFILAGIALGKLMTLLTQPLFRALLLLVAALPGILFTVKLHPYEYVYYNALIGGTGGAYRKFEMDYWGVSLQAIAEKINSVAPPNAKVLVFGPEQIVQQYARLDIRVYIPEEQPSVTYDYVVFLTRENLDERRCKGAVPVYSVGRRGAVFSILKSIPGGTQCN